MPRITRLAKRALVKRFALDRPTCAGRTASCFKTSGLRALLDGQAAEVNDFTLNWQHATLLSRELIGLDVFTWGRFGNAVYSNVNALKAAAHLGLKHVILCDGDGLMANTRSQHGDLSLYTRPASPRRKGVLLRGPFWDDQGAWPTPTPGEGNLIARTMLRPLMAHRDADERPADEVAVHIRGGDIFSTDINPLYVQPPLAFYKKAIAVARQTHGVRAVRIVTEDFSNPCVMRLREHLATTGMTVSVQSKSWIEDFVSLIDAKHLVYGMGTFAQAASLMSVRHDSVYTFAHGIDPASHPWIGAAHNFFDSAGRYMKQGEWSACEAQQQMMTDYPDDAIVEMV